MASMKVILVAAIVCLAMPSEAIDCSNNRCTREGRTQTLCLYPNPNPAPACGKVQSTGFTNSEKDEIVNKHNELRQFVARGAEHRGNPGPQPAASNMKIMSWDDELATVAQRWANQCNFGHDSCRSVERFVVGQNVASTSTTGQQNSKPSDLIMMWYNEVEKMDNRLVDKLTNINDVGHYTQLVWADSYKIGCGKIIYQDGQWNTYYLVCNYGPAGNYINSPIYQRRN
ncbi:venom allergen 3-like [Hylaeus volcanicus]|uniref:venom allergen 3-like n=1 Tax=Hylaeus volcanicus TaxID=313075 RepID=UPI0023B808E3|nr:venom allergen 3-like [Hylaeus volcanicus]